MLSWKSRLTRDSAMGKAGWCAPPLKMRDLVKDELEAEEDRVLTGLAKDRVQTFDRKKALTYAQTWAPLERLRR